MPAKPQTTNRQSHLAPIPNGLQRQLQTFRRSLWRIKVTEALLAGCLGLVASFLMVFLLDRLFETPASLRLIILLTGTSLFTVFAPYWIHRWVYRHRREHQLARLISIRFPNLGDRLLGAIELQDQKEKTENLSPQLRAAAMRDVAKEASKLDLTAALPHPSQRKWLLAVVALSCVTAALLIGAPDAGINSFKRWIMPYASTERFTFTRLDLSAIGTPERVPYGEAFSLTIPLAKDTGHKPMEARARYGNDDWVQAARVKDTYTFHFAGQRAMDTVTVEAHDARHELPFEPVMRPETEGIEARVELPDYLQRSDSTSDLRSGYISLLEGSSMSIETTTTRKLLSASAELVTLPQHEQTQPTTPSIEDSTASEPTNKTISKTVKLEIEGKTLTSEPFAVAKQAMILTVDWRDIYKLSAATPFQIRIEPVQDQAPSSYLNEIERQHIMLEEETIEFKIVAEDDFGLKACGISWEGSFSKPTTGSPASGELTVTAGNPTKTNITSPFSFSPANLSIKPQKISLRSWTEDYKPGRGRVYSEPTTLYVLSRTEHAQVLKNRFDSAIGQLEDVARQEQNLNDENLRTERDMGEDLQSESSREKLKRQQDSEAANQERMEEISKRVEEIFKDAVRNGEIEKESLKKMSDALQSMKELSQQDLPQIGKKLEDAQDRRNTNNKSKKDLKEAIEQQNEAIKKMQKAIKDAKEANQMFEAGTFVNRLKKAARTQDSIANGIIGIIDTIIGSSFDDLDPVEQRSIRKSHTQQRENAIDIKWIQEDLSNYYSRTQNPEHKELYNIIQKSMADAELIELAKRISANLSFASISQSKYWAQEIRKWVKHLEGDKNNSGGGAGGGGGGSQEEQDFEFMLKVMRMIQQEQNIRGRTRALEDLRRSLQKPPPKTQS
ncbi:MAG: hypothetical protein P8P36_08585 [Akkermansiaceae bacterium]|nr:hypothetical protein [Akkermansiaceae bacterium]